ncbi:MAG: hypothetical protein KDB27_20455 [Planctomycetales bacterium]|nr:hypothetical protein [Planctomycetales bacterium]
MNDADKQSRLESLRKEVEQLERELSVEPETWRASDSSFYGAYHATTGVMLGAVGAMASLLFNVVGSAIIGQHPLRLIQVYLTFPLGEKALSDDFASGMALALGCCLYIATGMLLGIPFQMAFARFMPNADLIKRAMFATVIGIGLWLLSFYGAIAWLQPLLFHGDWIIDSSILPPWVGAATHLVFAWTMALVYPWGALTPYTRQTRTQSS